MLVKAVASVGIKLASLEMIATEKTVAGSESMPSRFDYGAVWRREHHSKNNELPIPTAACP